jgi:peptidoglycan-N-acetylglucosamine deacetylase
LASRVPFFITTSWDDGTIHDLRLAGLLSKYGLPATFYVAKHHPYGGLSEHEIRELGHSFELGAHTLHHVVVDSVTDELAAAEIRESRTWIEQLSGRPCHMFCFPRGKFLTKHVRMVKESGFNGARTVELMSSRTPRIACGIAIVPTTIQAFPHKRSAYLKNIFRRGHISNLITYLHTEQHNWIAAAESLLSRISSRGGVFHLWGHAWELDQRNLWRDLEVLFQIMERYKEQGTLVTNADLCKGAAV